jgi:hypothetical protein
MHIMVEQQYTTGIADRLSRVASPIGHEDLTCREHRRLRGRDATVNWAKVHKARQRLAAGQYDGDDVLEKILDVVLADLAK